MPTSGGFVGRRSDLAELDAVIDAAVAGRGQLVLMPGEAGIGKTRLAEEVAVRARSRALDVAWAGCTEAEVASSSPPSPVPSSRRPRRPRCTATPAGTPCSPGSSSASFPPRAPPLRCRRRRWP